MANYYICAVHYDTYNHDHISSVKATYNLNDEISSASEKSKTQVVSDIESGHNVKTKYKSSYSWREGDDVRVVHGQSGKYIRTDANRTEKDNLGNLPEY